LALKVRYKPEHNLGSKIIGILCAILQIFVVVDKQAVLVSMEPRSEALIWCWGSAALTDGTQTTVQQLNVFQLEESVRCARYSSHLYRCSILCGGFLLTVAHWPQQKAFAAA